VLARVPATEAGAASGLVNTSMQIGMAAGIALIGTILFSLLSSGGTFVTAATRSLWVSAGLFVGSAALLPAPAGTGRGRPAGHAARRGDGGEAVADWSFLLRRPLARTR
jgi:hypothetical protein